MEILLWQRGWAGIVLLPDGTDSAGGCFGIAPQDTLFAKNNTESGARAASSVQKEDLAEDTASRSREWHEEAQAVAPDRIKTQFFLLTSREGERRGCADRPTCSACWTRSPAEAEGRRRSISPPKPWAPISAVFASLSRLRRPGRAGARPRSGRRMAHVKSSPEWICAMLVGRNAPAERRREGRTRPCKSGSAQRVASTAGD